MARLSDLTDRTAVESALREFRATGRDAFLVDYGFDRSRDYFIRVGDELFDSKPILAAAFGAQYPARGPLSPTDFSGGNASTARALRRLGFEVVTRVELDPPNPGDEFDSRTDIYERYGGDRIAGIVRFPGDDIVNVFSDAEGPYADDPPHLTRSFGYRGEGLHGAQRLEAGGNALLERARTSEAAIRYWYRPIGGRFAFVTWVAVIGRTWVAGVGADTVARPELEWQLNAVADRSSGTWPADVVLSIAESSAVTADSPDAPEASPRATYRQLVNRVEARGQPRRPNGVVRTDYARSAAARRAVIARCAGRCENKHCTGMPPDRNRRGEPILEVDHVRDLALRGADHPSNMIALCPNCHAVKTRGSERARWQREFVLVAKTSHEIAYADARDGP